MNEDQLQLAENPAAPYCLKCEKYHEPKDVYIMRTGKRHDRAADVLHPVGVCEHKERPSL